MKYKIEALGKNRNQHHPKGTMNLPGKPITWKKSPPPSAKMDGMVTITEVMDWPIKSGNQ